MKWQIKAAEEKLQKLRMAKRALEAWCMVMVLIMDRGIITADRLSKHIDLTGGARITAAKLSASVLTDGIVPLVLFIIFFTFYWQIAKIPFEKCAWTHIVAAPFSAFVLVGYSFAKTQGLDLIVADQAQMIKSVIEFIGYYGMFHPCIKLLYMGMEQKHLFVRKRSKWKYVDFLLEKHPFLSAFLIIIFAWLPYLIGYYPGIFMGDTGAQISQFFQLPNGTSSYLNLISSSQLINNHHPVLHTVLMGGCVKIGRTLFGSDNLGIFMYTLFQYFCCAGAISYGISYLRKMRLPYWAQGGMIFFAAVYPVFPRYAVLLSKDTLFSSVFLIYVIFLVDLVRNPWSISGNRKRQAAWIGVMILMMMLRQNGIYAVLFSVPVFLLYIKKKKYLICMIRIFAVSVGVYLLYTNVLFPALSITPGSRREMLSVPFQQTARYVKDHQEEVTEKEKEAISAVLDYDRLATLYDPNISDPVKKTFNEDATKKELNRYFKTWFQMFFKHPGTYIQATLGNYYGYFYMGEDATDRRVRYYQNFSQKCMNQRINEKGFDFYYPAQTENVRGWLEMYSEAVIHMPILSIFQASAFYTWAVILCVVFLIWKKRCRGLIVFLPALSVVLVCMVSPVNGTIYFRYMLALMYTMPVLLGYTVKTEGGSLGRSKTGSGPEKRKEPDSRILKLLHL